MQMADIGGNIRLHYQLSGPEDGPALVLSGALGTDLRMWDNLLPHLPGGLRVLRYDMRGHGLSTCPDGPYYMGDMVADIATLMQRLELREVAFVGLSIGGMIAQGLAAERLDLVRGLVLSNTAAKIATPAIWQQRIDEIRANGIGAIAFANMERWFSRRFRTEAPGVVEGFLNMVMRTPLEGYVGAAEAIAETDLYESTARLTLPTLGIAGGEDGSTPADLVRESVGLINGARFELIRGTGHLPSVEKPGEYAALISSFLTEIGHI